MGRAVSLVGAVFALLCVVLVLLVVPAGAQDGGIPPGTAANGSNPDNPSDPPNIVTIAASGCTVAAGASITLEDGDGTRAIFTDGDRGITIISQDGRPRIEGPPGDFIGNHARFPTSDESFDTDGDYSVVSSTGVTGCRGGNAGEITRARRKTNTTLGTSMTPTTRFPIRPRIRRYPIRVVLPIWP